VMMALIGVSNLVVVALVVALVAAVLWPRLWGRVPIGGIGWGDAGLKALIIAVATIMLVAYLPSRILQTGTVAGQSRLIQDLIGTGVWSVGFVATLAGLHYLRRERRA